MIIMCQVYKVCRASRSLVASNRTIRTRLKMFSRLFLAIILLLFTMCSVCHSQPFPLDSLGEPGGSIKCPLNQCKTSSLNSQLASCNSILSLSNCIASLPKECRGVLQYHMLTSILEKKRKQCRSQHTLLPVRSADSSLNHQQQLSKGATVNLVISKPKYFQYCLSAAYNYTIGIDVLPNIPSRKSQQPPVLFEYPAKRRKFARESRAGSDLSAEQSATTGGFKPNPPMNPSLTCIIYGDPHIRTFHSQYQTCNCLGARSLIEHPLFDVQITNTQLNDRFNSTGVTKVTVIVRRFGPCAIEHELIYETDSLAQETPSPVFTDGSMFNYNNLTFISLSSQNKVATIHLDHIGVRIYISQFPHTKFLNVVIKFRTATSTVNQNLVLNAISSISLCKAGCHPRELVDIQRELEKESIGLAQPVVVNSVSGGDEVEDNEEDSDSFPVYVDGTNDDDQDEYNFDENILAFRSQRRIGRNAAEEPKKRKRNRNRKKNGKKSQLTTRQLNFDAQAMFRSIVAQQNAPILSPQPVENDCSSLIGYYRSTCLYDTKVKGVKSSEPHRFARSFDEPRLIDTPLMNQTEILASVTSGASTDFTSTRMTLFLLFLASILHC